MKHLAAILLLVCFSLKSYSQKFTITELYTMLNAGYEFFDTKALQKGFEFDSTYTTENNTAYHYTFQRTKEGKAQQHLSWTSWKDGPTYISYQMREPKEYLSFKTELKKLNFNLTKTETVNGVLFFDYKRDNKLVTLASGKTGNDDPVGNFYEISVEYSK
jgi:hypothetical protein